MTTTDQFLLAYQAYKEVQAELRQNVSLSHNVKGLSSQETEAAIPSGSLLLGIAEDGLPVLLDLYDPAPGPLLVAGDEGSGKTTYLQALAQATNLQDPGDIQFGVLTPFPEEWHAQERLPGCLGIWPEYHPSAQDFLDRLISWAEVLPETRQVILLFVDGLDLLTRAGSHLRQNLRWFFSHGPMQQVWPVVTVDPGRLSRLQSWLAFFPTRIFGRIRDRRVMKQLVDDSRMDLGSLDPGCQFYLHHANGWLRFQLVHKG